jgi:hypothetical protein
MSSKTVMPDSLNPRPSVSFKTLMVLSVDGFISFFNGALLNFSKMVELELLMMGI